MPRPPSAMARPGASPFGSTSVPPACAMRAFKPAGADAVEQRDRRHVERHLQRAARRHRALERQVEILRRIAAIAHRPVLDQRFGMRDAVLEGEPVDERLQRRAGRAQRVGHVDLAGAALVEIVRRRRPAPALRRWHCPPRGSRPRDRARAPRARSRARSSRFFCKPASMVSRWTLRLRQRRDRLIGGMRRQRRHRPARARQRASSLASAISSAGTLPALAMRSSTRSRAAPRRIGRTVRPAQLRRLRQRDQQRRLGKRKPLRLLAEIGERGGAHAFEIAAIGRERQVKREHLVLAQAAARSRSRARSAGAWRRACVRSRGSSRRATCMVKVEPPEMMRPLPMNCTAARSIASGSTPRCSRKRRSS